MQRIPVRSSNLRSVGYDAESQLLEVGFRSRKVYQYSRVPPSVHGALMAAPSHGKYFSARVRLRYSYRQVQ